VFISVISGKTFCSFSQKITMYEKKSQPLASRSTYYQRILKNLLVVLSIMIFMLTTGTIGYHFATAEKTGWIDAFHNASMILSGMGPLITEGFNQGGKIFSSIYALFSGIVFVGAMGYLFAPGLHRLYHRFHLEEDNH
jgi:hypothetical protein